MKAPAGANVGIYVDLVATVSVGDVIETTSGRKYLVTSVRVQERGKHAGRQHLRVTVLDDEAWRAVATHMPRRHVIRWYPRGRKARR